MVDVKPELTDMVTIPFPMFVAAVAVIWVILRLVCGIIHRGFDWKYELKLVSVLITILVIGRFVYFPWRLSEGHIRPLEFDAGKIRYPRINMEPFVHILDSKVIGKRNLIGNIGMFVPVGLIWPVCFRGLDRIWKVVLAGAFFSLLIELSQLLFYTRGTDIDDLILNTAGVAVGAVIWMICRRNVENHQFRERRI